MDTTWPGHAATGAGIDVLLDRFLHGELTLPALAASCFEAGRIAATADRAEQVLGAAAAPVAPGVDPSSTPFAAVVHTEAGVALPLVRHDSPRVSPAPVWFLIRASRPVTDHEIERLWHAAAYAWKASARGEAIGRPMRVTAESFYCEVDLTTSRRTDPAEALADFEDTLVRLVVHGSALRTSDRAGVGTKGTRAVDPFGDPTLVVDLLWPAVVDQPAQDPTSTPAVDEFGPTPGTPPSPPAGDVF